MYRKETSTFHRCAAGTALILNVAIPFFVARQARFKGYALRRYAKQQSLPIAGWGFYPTTEKQYTTTAAGLVYILNAIGCRLLGPMGREVANGGEGSGQQQQDA